MNSSPATFCTLCQTMKTADDFYNDSSRENGKANRCKACSRKYNQEAYRRDPEKSHARIRAWHAKNKGRVAFKRRTPERREQIKYAVAKNHYGITKNQILEMRQVQQDRCLICSASLVKKFHIDHNHETTAVRGLLCLLCNVGMGSFKDNPSLLRRAAFYLESRSEFDARKVYAA